MNELYILYYLLYLYIIGIIFGTTPVSYLVPPCITNGTALWITQYLLVIYSNTNFNIKLLPCIG